jgi:hypothetical protein
MMRAVVLDLDDARKRYGWALTPEDQQRLPFYAGLVRALGDDDTALRLLAEVRVQQRNPMLILAALHYVALEGHPVLGPLYGDVRHGRDRSVDEMVTTVMSIIESDPDLVRAQMHRSTQTNEPGRSAVLRAALPYVTAGSPRVNLLDIGTSAGLNLYPDMFRVSSQDDPDPMTLVCRDEGPVDRSQPLPQILTRTGVDLNPLDLNNPDDQRWLEACVWPEERRRFERLEAIIQARAAWPHVTILRGDALERIDDGLSAGDPSVVTVITNTWFAAYLSREEQTAYYERLTELCARGGVAWISLELPVAVSWPEARGSTTPPEGGATQVMVTRPGDSPEHFGWCHHHGRWLIRDATTSASAGPARPTQ